MKYPFGKCFQPSNELKKSHIHTSLRLSPKSETNTPFIIDYAEKNLPLSGVVEIDSRGFVYLNVSDRYILDLKPMIKEKGTRLPPYFESDLPGAHISLVLPSENLDRIAPSFVGRKIDFSLIGCYKVEPDNWESVRLVWFLEVASDAFSQIRSELGLSPNIGSLPFHITIGIEPHHLSIYDFLSATEERQIKISSQS